MRIPRSTIAALAAGSLAAAGLGARAAAEVPPLLHAASAYQDAAGAALRGPEGVACTDSGRVVVGDTANGRLVMFSFREGRFGPGETIRFEQLGRPFRVQIDARGNLLSLDQKSRRIVKVAPDGSFGGFLELKNLPAGRAAPFAGSFKLDRNDNVYVLDLANTRVLVTDPGGAFLRALPLPPGGFITDIAVDRGGAVYAVDGVRAMVYVATREATAFAAKTRPLKEFMNFPSYLEAADRGRLVLVDRHGNGLVVVGPEGTFQGRQLAMGWNDGLVYYPSQICLMGSTTVVADRNNHRVQAFVSSER